MKNVIISEYIGQYEDQYNKLWSGILDAASEGMGEFIRSPSSRPWVAEITGTDPRFGFARKFVDGKKDLKNSSSNGNRGVYIRFVVDEGRVYEVSRKTSWKNRERFFCLFENGEMRTMDRSEVLTWIQNQR